MAPDIDETHDPRRRSWVQSADDHPDFPIQNLPLGIFSRPGEPPRGGIAIGDLVLDLAALTRSDLLAGKALAAAEAADAPSLNALLALGAAPRRALRRAVSALLETDAPDRGATEALLVPLAEVTMHLPAQVGDYTDFYVGIHHATAVGAIFRPDNPLLPNYKHVPIGYHGRVSTIRPSGTKVARPLGQTKPPEAAAPSFGPTVKLDYELELGVWIAQGNAQGTPIPIVEAASHVAGLTLLNDWSARDVQAWEYQPLGPFLAKNFLTTVSPWLVTAEALAPFRRPQPPRPAGDPRPLPYLWDEADQAHGSFALTMEVHLASAAMRAQGLAPLRLSRGTAEAMYWTIAQMVTHHASNGCALQAGDLLGTGTLSGPDEGTQGSLMEITRNGSRHFVLPTGETRTFLEDGDELVLTGRFKAEGFRAIGFGPCAGTVAAARV
jgi:fumarylacetoacetase